MYIETGPINSIRTISFPVPQPPMPAYPVKKCYGKPKVCEAKCEQKEVENTMNIETQTRDYLLNRLAVAVNAKRPELTEMFNIYVRQEPKSYKELIDWIKNDKFKLDAKRTKQIDDYVADDDWFGSFVEGITWTGSDRPVDMDGYNAAVKEQAKRSTAAKDIIMTGTPADGLKAIQDFEAWTPVGKSN